MAIAAAGAHGGGNGLAETAADFLMVHAAAVLAGSVLAAQRGGVDILLATSLGLLTAGATLFGGELALAGLTGWRPLPLAAPTGGLCLIAGWLVMTAFAAHACFRFRDRR